MNNPETPVATAARAKTGTNSRCPPEELPLPPGNCTECVASNTTGQPVARMMDNERMHRVLRRVADQSGKPVEEVLAQELQFISMRTMVSMEEVAHLAWFLCSPQAAHITGQLVAVDGGSEWES